MSEVLRHVIDSITTASAAQAEAVRRRVAPAGVPMFERLAGALAAAQHTAKIRVDRRTLVIVAGDHGVGDPGLSLGPAHPTVIAARAIADGTAAVAHVARTARTPIVLVDAGVREPDPFPDIAIALGRGPSRDLLVEPAMAVEDASLGLDAGIALVVSLADAGLDVLALGALGIGADVASAALLGAAIGGVPALPTQPTDVVASATQGTAPDRIDRAAGRAGALGAAAATSTSLLTPLELVARFGSSDTAVLAGAILAAASMNIPVILDSYATGAAALVAEAFAPASTGYMIASHAGTFTHPLILRHLGLSPIFEVGLGHGDGTGAAMILSLLDQVVGLTTGP